MSIPQPVSGAEEAGVNSDGDAISAALETTDGKQLVRWKGKAVARVGGYEFGASQNKLRQQIKEVFEDPNRLDAASA